MTKRIEADRILETLVQNAQVGEPYRLKLEGDPLVYEGIPLSRPGDTTHDDDAFRMQVTAPEAAKGTKHGRIQDIEWLERVR